MSDQPPSGSTEPVPPASAGTPADPASSPSPGAQPAARTPGHVGHPDPFGQFTPTDPTRAAQPGAAPGQPFGPPQPGQPGPTAPGQPVPDQGFAAPGQSPYPAGPGGQSPYGTGPGGQPWYSGPPAGAFPGDPSGQPHAWSWPVPGGAYPGQPYGWQPGVDPDDPLVTPPYAGIGGWFTRCAGVLRRSWRPLVPIMLLSQGLPAAVIAVLSVGFAPPGQPVTGPTGATALPDGYLQDIFLLYGAVLLAALVFGPLQAAGWAAGTWLVTRQAAGEPVTVGAAFRYGWHRSIGLWGWTFVASLLMLVGFCACFLPGVYVMFAVALFGPVYLFERQDPMGRSFGIFHKRFGPVLGRVALVVAVLVVMGLLNGLLDLIGQFAFGLDPMAAPGTAVGAVLLAVAGAVLGVPAYLAQLVGLLVTYTEQRAHEGPVNTARLAAELG